MRQKAKQIIQEWNHETTAKLCQGLQLLLDHAGDVLVDFASKSESNVIQSEFFDAQRELFLKGAYTIPQFRSQLQTTNTGLDQHPEPGADTLSLLDKDDYDLSVALDTIADNCSKRNEQNLHAFIQRLSAITGGRQVNAQQVPLNPRVVTQAFQRATDSLEVNKRVQLVLFTLFDRYVVSLLDEAYSLINQHLADAGVLPTIKFQIRRRASAQGSGLPATATQPDASQAAESGSDLAGSGEVFVPAAPTSPPSTEDSIRAIRDLLHSRRASSNQPSRPATPAQQQASIQQVNQAIDSPDVQSHVSTNAAPVLNMKSDKVIVDKQLMVKVREALHRQREMIKSLLDQKNLTEQEQDVIEIVGLLFESILDDDNLPLPVKTLLSHLHTPYLKIAVNDPSFLQGNAHPARSLLDDMLQIGTRWVNPEKLNQGIFPTLQHCVRKIIDNPVQADFEQLKEELLKREKQLKQNRSLTEKRTLEAEKGQAMLTQARDTARSAVHTLLAEHQLPTPVRVFLQTLFADYLSLLLLRNKMDPKHPKCVEALNHCVKLIEKVSAGDNQAATGAAIPLGELITDLLPHYETQIEKFIEELQKPLKADQAPPPKPAFIDPHQSPSSDEQKALELQPGTWLNWQPKGQETSQPIKLIWTNPHTRNLLFVDQNGAKAAQMQARDVSRGLADGTLSQQVRPKHGSLLNGLLEGIRERLSPTHH